jgi:hypothetical protein
MKAAMTLRKSRRHREVSCSSSFSDPVCHPIGPLVAQVGPVITHFSSSRLFGLPFLADYLILPWEDLIEGSAASIAPSILRLTYDY